MRAPTLSFLLLFAASAGLAESGARIKGLTAIETRGAIAVRFTLENGFQPVSTLQNLESGVPVGVTYQVELVRSRPNWFDETVAATRIEVICTFNSATREYLMSYRRDRRLVRSQAVADMAELERALTVIDERELFAVSSQRLSRLRVRVRATLGLGYYLLMLPADTSTNWKATRVRRSEAGQ